MSLSRINELNYARRTAMEVNTAKERVIHKDLEITLLENLRELADIDYYYDSDYNTTTYVAYLKSELNYKLFEE